MPVRTQNPIFLLFYRMPPSGAAIPEAGHGTIELSSDYTSYFRVDMREEGSLAMLDGELWRNTLRARLGLGRSAALELELPMLYGGGGFLDRHIEDYHDLFGFNQEGRDKNPDDQFGFLLASEGGIAYRLPENELAVGDISLTFDWLARRETDGAPGVLLRAGLELATGDETRGFGSGHTDGGVGLALRKRLGAYHLYGNVAYQLLTRPDAFVRAGVKTRNNWTADVGAERALGVTTSIVLQFGFEESPLIGNALQAVDDNSSTVTFGVVVRPAERWGLDFYFVEDVDGESTQDFSAHMGVRYTW